MVRWWDGTQRQKVSCKYCTPGQVKSLSKSSVMTNYLLCRIYRPKGENVDVKTIGDYEGES